MKLDRPVVTPPYLLSAKAAAVYARQQALGAQARAEANAQRLRQQRFNHRFVRAVLVGLAALLATAVSFCLDSPNLGWCCCLIALVCGVRLYTLKA